MDSGRSSPVVEAGAQPESESSRPTQGGGRTEAREATQNRFDLTPHNLHNECRWWSSMLRYRLRSTLIGAFRVFGGRHNRGPPHASKGRGSLDTRDRRTEGRKRDLAPGVTSAILVRGHAL